MNYMVVNIWILYVLKQSHNSGRVAIKLSEMELQLLDKLPVSHLRAVAMLLF
jgi:hypothetical protein